MNLIARSIVSLILLAGALNAQNLLRWDKWTTVNKQFVYDTTIDEQRLVLRPYSESLIFDESIWPGFDQAFSVAADGLYQVHLNGSIIDGRAQFDLLTLTEKLPTGRQSAWGIQVGHTMQLKAGSYTMRMRVMPGPWPGLMALYCVQPVVRPVVAPTIDTRILMSGSSDFDYTIGSDAVAIFASPRRLDEPMKIAGFGHGLELDPAAGIILVAAGDCSRLNWLFWQRNTSPHNFYLQAISLSPAAFGSRLYVR